jgi:hypothetical protein
MKLTDVTVLRLRGTCWRNAVIIMFSWKDAGVKVLTKALRPVIVFSGES